MPRSALTEKDLRRELEDLGERYPKLGPDELFVLWFLTAYVTDDERAAAKALTGGSSDKGVDAVHVDPTARIVFLVEGKRRQKLGIRAEVREDVGEFAGLAELLAGESGQFSEHCKGLDPQVAERLREARRHVLQSKYRLKLYYVTLGRFTAVVRHDAEVKVRRASCETSLHLLDGREMLRLLGDYLDGVAPPIPSMDLEVESGSGIVLKGILQRHDDRTKIESWAFPMTATAVAEMYEHAGRRLFARNIRGYLGTSKEINRGIERSLEKEPEYFWYYNNGITMVCDNAQSLGSGGREVLHVENPQIINGQQTTRVLHSHQRRGMRASVLVRVIRVPRDSQGSTGRFDELVSNIVAATNSQNYITPSDLMSNDRRQVEIERQLRKFDYQYLRKRQTKGEARAAAGSRYRFIIKKEELAQAVAACDLDPLVVRSGKERLFEERWYQQVFPNADPHYYLPRYWLMLEVGYVAKGYPERAYAKWLVLNYVWSQLAPILKGKAAASTFWKDCERDEWLVAPLLRAIDAVFVAAISFYRHRRGKGAKAIDVSTFFKRRGLDVQFKSFWGGSGNLARARFNRRWAQFTKRFRQALEG